MRPLSLTLCLAVSACGGGSTSSGVANHTTPTAATGPAPTVAFTPDPDRYGDFQLTGLPAVARNGELVVVQDIDSDGGRGNPNLTIVVRNRQDQVVETIKVMDAVEFEEHADLVKTRTGSANQRLAALHAEHDLVPMKAAPLPTGVTVEAVGAKFPAPGAHGDCDGMNPASGVDTYRADGVELTVVSVTYKGTDMCWEPGPQFHVLR